MCRGETEDRVTGRGQATGRRVGNEGPDLDCDSREHSTGVAGSGLHFCRITCYYVENTLKGRGWTQTLQEAIAAIWAGNDGGSDEVVLWRWRGWILGKPERWSLQD